MIAMRRSMLYSVQTTTFAVMYPGVRFPDAKTGLPPTGFWLRLDDPIATRSAPIISVSGLPIELTLAPNVVDRDSDQPTFEPLPNPRRLSGL